LKIALRTSHHEIRAKARLSQSAEEQLNTELRGAALTRTVIFVAFRHAFEKVRPSDDLRSGFQAAGLCSFNANRPMESPSVRNKAAEILVILARPGNNPISCPFLRSSENLANLEASRSFVFSEDRTNESAPQWTRLTMDWFLCQKVCPRAGAYVSSCEFNCWNRPHHLGDVSTQVDRGRKSAMDDDSISSMTLHPIFDRSNLSSRGG
jgi:hypothetical protein